LTLGCEPIWRAMADSHFKNVGLHHIGYLVRDIRTAAVHFRDALGYTPESDMIEDPVQTALVQRP
jgi:hypothetical protein